MKSLLILVSTLMTLAAAPVGAGVTSACCDCCSSGVCGCAQCTCCDCATCPACK